MGSVPSRPAKTRAQDYKEKHKFDSKQISDSAFSAHLIFGKNRETVKLFDIKLKTRTQVVGAFMPGGGNVTKIGTQ